MADKTRPLPRASDEDDKLSAVTRVIHHLVTLTSRAADPPSFQLKSPAAIRLVPAVNFIICVVRDFSLQQ